MKALKKRNREFEDQEKSPKEELKKSEMPNFLLKLYQILETNEYSSIIEWGDNGKFFIVKNLNEFTDKVCPKFFKHNNFSSFVRQVRLRNNLA
jgi:osomolarity two-component system response regulator SKN7